MKILDLYRDYGVYAAVPGDKHYRDGWVNTPCPFCTGNPGNHLGYNLDDNYFWCWRCGGKGSIRVISELTFTSYQEAKQIIKRYGGEEDTDVYIKKQKVNLKDFSFPDLTEPLSNSHKRYLQKRGFDPEFIEQEWKVMGTGPISKLDDINYKNRIIIPIHWDRQIVSFQGRDITDRNPPKYKACPQAREIIEHQKILYRHPDYTGEVGICVEGVTDVWRLGRLSFAVFGIDYTTSQVNHISELYKEVIIWFDQERQAQIRARKLSKELIARGVKISVHRTDSDPGSLSQQKANIEIEKFL